MGDRKQQRGKGQGNIQQRNAKQDGEGGEKGGAAKQESEGQRSAANGECQ